MYISQFWLEYHRYWMFLGQYQYIYRRVKHSDSSADTKMFYIKVVSETTLLDTDTNTNLR